MQTWMYLTIPILFYACERLTRKLRENNYRVGIIKVTYSSYITKDLGKNTSDESIMKKKNLLPCVKQAAIYPGNVLSIHMTKPPGFKYQSGMYLFIKCPDLSPFEWYV